MGGRLLVWLVLTSSLLTAVLGARILGVFPFPSRSHVVIYSTLLKELAARGHEVTVFSDYPLLTPVPNYTDVKLDLDKNVLAGEIFVF
ncbi:hypothetical protein PR048_017841 [Dryococelus australis]|uniref:Uncharacterized protein n=1 Tax=Dryococelus australis TaxID=614101 RepID=A0ABQ9HAR3_9NEOP|nr:hypothetical protein PR048_017841 [Dryococelus australis]